MNKAIILRYALLLERLKSGDHPSLNELIDFLEEHDTKVSRRTLQRDLETLRYDFGVEVVYDHDRSGYAIDETQSVNLDGFLRFLDIAGTAHLLTESLRESRETLDHVHFEADGEFKGMENLKDLLFAVKHHRTVTFRHENYHKGTFTDYTVQPYLLKEYQKRWYLVGLVPKLGESRTFGIDRIHGLKVTGKTFKPDPDKDPRPLFRQTIGLVYSFHDKEDVVLSVNPVQGRYLKSLPLHASQEIIEEGAEAVRLKVSIIPNYEFIQKVMMIGPEARVVRPQWIADWVRQKLGETLAHYQRE